MPEAPPGLAPARPRPTWPEPEVACVHGPFVLERAHDLRPEIHPAEVLWVRKAHDRGYWTFALLPDDSGRFRKAKHFEKGAAGDGWKPWSTDRPVELWVAFSTPAASPVVFDLSVKAFGKKPQPAEQVVLRPPDPGRRLRGAAPPAVVGRDGRRPHVGGGARHAPRAPGAAGADGQRRPPRAGAAAAGAGPVGARGSGRAAPRRRPGGPRAPGAELAPRRCACSASRACGRAGGGGDA